MLVVQKQNVVLEVEDDNVDKYLSNGFSVIDSNGNIVQGAKPTTVHDYQVLNADLAKDLESAKQKIAELEKKYQESLAKIKQLELNSVAQIKPLQATNENDTKPATRRRTKSTAKAE